MKCPRCGNEWDVSKSPCSRCGLRVRLPGPSGSIARTNQSQHPLQSEGMPVKQQTVASEAMLSFSPIEAPVTPIPLPIAGKKPAIGKQVQLMSSHVDNPVTPSPRSIPPRPQVSVVQTLEQLVLAPQHLQSPLRARRLVTMPSSRRSNLHTTGGRVVREATPLPASSSSNLHASKSALVYGSRLLLPGIVLRAGRYRLRELQSRQEWLLGAYEAVWIAQDAQRSGATVTICELSIPEQNTMRVQSLLRASTIALTSVGRHPRLPTLWDVFSDQGRNFFVFEPVAGESLLTIMRRTGRALPEKNVIECCLQVTEVLELLAQQTPPLVHGLIRPEHIFVNHDGARYILANFSVVLAGGGTPFIAGVDRSRLSLYSAPELGNGVINMGSDLYSLLATAYHAATGSVPTAINGSIPQAKRLNPLVSSQLDMILAKGLHISISQRYQHPSELHADLLLLQSSMHTLVGRGNLSLSEQRSQFRPDTISRKLPAVLSSPFDKEPDERRSLVRQPVEMPALEEQNVLHKVLLWLKGIFLCLIVLMLFSGGLQ